MSQTFVFLAACAVATLAVFATTSDAAAPIYVGYNATLCRNQAVTFAVRGNCSRFYQCLRNNTVWLNECAAPLLYNSTNGMCDYAWKVKCNPFNGLLLNVTRPNLRMNVNSLINRAIPIYIGYNYTLCRGYNGTHPVKGNCSAFYQCQNNNVWLNFCDKPLLYNPNNGYCDYAWNVNCNRFIKDAAPVARQVETAKQLVIPGQPPVNQCHSNEMVNCLVDPCMYARCKNNARAVCISDYCGGCNSRFFTVELRNGMYQFIPAICH